MAMREKAASAAPQAPGAAMSGRMRGGEAKKADGMDKDRAEEGLARREMRKNLAEELENSMAPAVAGVEVGDLFAYQAKEKVSVKRGQAALVPILSERVDGGERILFYRATVSGKPMNSYYFKNSTALTLEAGPVTIFDGSTCVGEGLMRKVLKKDMKDMIPYAVEAGVSIDRKVNQRSDPVTKGTIANGVLTLTYTQNYESTYSIKSQIGKDTVLYLDHPRTSNFKLAEPAKSEEEIDGHHRFKLELKAGQTSELKVRETMLAVSSISLLGTPAETIRFYLQQRYLSEAAKTLLRELIAAQGEINRLRGRENELAQERARITEDETPEPAGPARHARRAGDAEEVPRGHRQGRSAARPDPRGGEAGDGDAAAAGGGAVEEGVGVQGRVRRITNHASRITGSRRQIRRLRGSSFQARRDRSGEDFRRKTGCGIRAVIRDA
jgi:hypothetical protein